MAFDNSNYNITLDEVEYDLDYRDWYNVPNTQLDPLSRVKAGECGHRHDKLSTPPSGQRAVLSSLEDLQSDETIRPREGWYTGFQLSNRGMHNAR